MKKRKYTMIVIVLIILILLMIFGKKLYAKYKEPEIVELGNFNLADSQYQWGIENFPSNKNVGPTENAETAVKKAKNLWIEDLSMWVGKNRNPINGRAIEVSYDSKNECWHVNGTLAPNVWGSVPNVLIKKDGTVLAVWMD